MSKRDHHKAPPPQLAIRFLHWYCREELVDEVEGDLYELFQRRVEEQGLWKAKMLYWLNVLMFLHPDYIRKNEKRYSPNHIPMFRHYFNISTRILLKHKFYTTINILGLAVGMGVCLLIYQYVHFEFSYDKFHDSAQNIYRLKKTTIKNGEDQEKGVYATYGLGPAGKENIPEIEEYVRINEEGIGFVLSNPEKNEPHLERKMWYVDSNFLQMFDLPLLHGDKTIALNEKHSIVITEQIAKKYFGEVNPLGRTLKVSGGWAGGEYIVSGILKDLPNNTHLQFDFLLPMKLLLENSNPYQEDNGWGWNRFVTYVKVTKTANLKEVSEKFDAIIDNYIGEKLAQSNEKLIIGFQALTDVHLKSGFQRELANNNGDIRNVRLFGLIGLFILVNAWVNYINLSTARAMRRAKEVGVRKAIGAIKKQLISQFLIESVLINVMAAIIAMGVAYAALPVLNDIIGQDLSFSIMSSWQFWMWFTFIVLLGSLLSGLYPAFILSSFKPLSILKSTTIYLPKKRLSLRSSLIVFQFICSVLLISGSYLIFKQVNYMQSQDLGFDMEKILVLDGPRVILDTDRPALLSKYQAFKNSVLAHSSIKAVSATSQVPGRGFIWTGGMRKLGDPQDNSQEGNLALVDADFPETYDFDLLAGRSFTEDMAQREGILINEKAVNSFGLGTPEKALSEKLIVLGDTLKVLGVVKNVHWNSLKEAYSPMVFWLDNEYGAYFSIKLNLANVQESISVIKSSFRTVFPDDSFYYFFLDEDFNRHYQADLQFRNLFTLFSGLAIFIACIGLFALVSYSATLRIKEIGIRKVLGAGVGHLMMLLSREYLLLLLISVGIAFPVIIIGGKNWLENFAYKVGISFDLFLLPSLILLFISILTVGYRIYNTAKANPIDSLKTE